MPSCESTCRCTPRDRWRHGEHRRSMLRLWSWPPFSMGNSGQPSSADSDRHRETTVPRRFEAMKSKIKRSAMWGRSTLLLGAMLILAAGVAFAGRAKLSKDLEGKKGSDQVNVIVQFNAVPSAKH